MNSSLEGPNGAPSGADRHATLLRRLEYSAPTLLRSDLARVIAGPGGSQYDDDFASNKNMGDP